MSKALGELWWETRYLYSFKIVSHKSLNNYEGKSNNFMIENPDRCFLNQVVKVNITNNWTNWHQVPSNVMQWEHNITSVVFL